MSLNKGMMAYLSEKTLQAIERFNRAQGPLFNSIGTPDFEDADQISHFAAVDAVQRVWNDIGAAVQRGEAK